MSKFGIARLAAAAACVALLTAGPASADGLARFEKEIKSQIPDGALTYKSSKALGDDGFVLSDVVVTPPPTGKDSKDKPQPINIKTVTVDHLDFDAIEKKQPPLFADIKIEGISSGSNPGGAFDLKEFTGLDKVDADFQLDYKLKADAKTFTLDKLELNLNGLAKLDTSMVLDGVSADVAAKPDEAMNDASLKSATLVYEDHSLLSKVIPVVAALQGSDPKALIAMATLVLDGARAGQSADSQKAIDTLVAFVEDYQKPKGPLKVTLSPPDKVTSAQLNDAKSADQVIKLLGIEVAYAGTRTSKPMDIPPPADKPDTPTQK